MTHDEFLAALLPLAISAERTSEIPAEVIVGQAVMESNWGNSGLTLKANNLFGIKAGGNWGGPSLAMVGHEYVHGRLVSVPIEWRKYPSWEASVLDHTKFLQKDRYKAAFKYKNDFPMFLIEIQKAGYATDPHYADGILKVLHSGAPENTIIHQIEKVRQNGN